MNVLPIILSVPHAGKKVPAEVLKFNLLNREQIIRDGDEFSDKIYFPLLSLASEFVVADIARAYVDLNRAPDDIRKDGVVKTHTIFDEPIYTEALEADIIDRLIAKYHAPHMKELGDAASNCKLGIDCHTMAETAPPIASVPGSKRPYICLSDGNGTTCGPKVTAAFASKLEETFSCEVSINDPFRGGYITRSRPGGIPWLQLEISREPWIEHSLKRLALRWALLSFGQQL